jgi:hypothetical protein
VGVSARLSAVRDAEVPSGPTHEQLAYRIRGDLREREAERDRLTDDLGREIVQLKEGDGDEARLREVEALLAEVERAIRLDRAALSYLG